MFAVNSTEMNAIDQYMIKTIGLPSLVLMENASKTVIDGITDIFPLSLSGEKAIVVLCGTGNNGGDGLCISRWLKHKGYDVEVFLVGNKDKLKGDVNTQYMLIKSQEAAMEEIFVHIIEDSDDRTFLYETLQKSHLIVDALIGTGCHRTLSPLMSDVVKHVNDCRGLIVSVDIPTGIDSDNGTIMGDAVHAAQTITFCLPKLGHILYPGSNYCGKLTVADIGIFEKAFGVLENPITLLDITSIQDYKLSGKFKREKMSHKGTFGTVGIIGGDNKMMGATILAAKAAYKSGAGLVKVFIEEQFGELILSVIPECIIVPYESTLSKEKIDREIELFAFGVDCILIGQGLSKSPKARHLLRKVLQLETKVILDADALNIISEHLEWLETRLCDVVITPHIGEMSRLTGCRSLEISENALQFAEAFSAKYQITTVLKSSRTVIVTKSDKRYINILGNSGLATAGSGDVLSGVTAGLAAQGYTLEDSAIIGTLLHSYAGDMFAKNYGEHALVASDIIRYLWRGI